MYDAVLRRIEYLVKAEKPLDHQFECGMGLVMSGALTKKQREHRVVERHGRIDWRFQLSRDFVENNPSWVLSCNGKTIAILPERWINEDAAGR